MSSYLKCGLTLRHELSLKPLNFCFALRLRTLRIVAFVLELNLKCLVDTAQISIESYSAHESNVNNLNQKEGTRARTQEQVI